MTTRRTALAGLLVFTAATASAAWAREARAQGARAQGPPAAAPRLALKGYDPVAYFTDGRPVEGAAQYEVVWDGQRYRFASARHRDLFKADPDKYAPQFGGSCAMNMAAGVRRESDPHNWVISNGNLYVFAGVRGRETFSKAPATHSSKAAAHWQTMKPQPTQ